MSNKQQGDKKTKAASKANTAPAQSSSSTNTNSSNSSVKVAPKFNTTVLLLCGLVLISALVFVFINPFSSSTTTSSTSSTPVQDGSNTKTMGSSQSNQEVKSPPVAEKRKELKFELVRIFNEGQLVFGLALNATGHLFVTGTKGIHVYNQTGTLVHFYGAPEYSKLRMHIDKNDTYYIWEGGWIKVITPENREAINRTISPFSTIKAHPQYYHIYDVITHKDLAYVVHGSTLPMAATIGMFNSTGDLVGEFKQDPKNKLKNPTSMAFDGNKRLYIGDEDYNKIHVYNMKTKSLEKIIGKQGSPRELFDSLVGTTHIKLNGTGYLITGEKGCKKLSLLSEDGEVKATYEDGMFWPDKIVADAEAGIIYVHDWYYRKTTVLRLVPK